MSRPFHGFPVKGAFRGLLRGGAVATLVGCALVATLVTTAAGGCSNLRTLPGWRRAVVIAAPSRTGDAETARLLLAADGWQVDVVPQGPAARTRSSVAVYDARKYPKMPDHVREVLEPLGATGGDDAKIDVLPFLTAGPGGSSVVLWLAD